MLQVLSRTQLVAKNDGTVDFFVGWRQPAISLQNRNAFGVASNLPRASATVHNARGGLPSVTTPTVLRFASAMPKATIYNNTQYI